MSDFSRFKDFLAKRLGETEALATAQPDDVYRLARAYELSEDAMAGLVAECLGLPCIAHIPASQVNRSALPLEFCQSNAVVSLHDADGQVAFATSNPFRWEVIELLRMHTEPGAATPAIRIAAPKTFERLFAEGVPEVLDLVEAPRLMTPRPSPRTPVPRATRQKEELLDVTAPSKVPTVTAVNEILSSAVEAGASDIHVEPRQDEAGVRFRIDGMLVEQPPVAKDLEASVISRFKILAQLDIAERRVPQDGRMRVLYDGRPIDLRLSTLPTRHGEKVVIRILDKDSVSLDLAKLGLEQEALAALTAAIEKPHGILLVTGPTGSGKTTTLYSALTALNLPHRNIVTVEDPVEYDLPRVNQVQVNVLAGLTFPIALRSILRQDPDVVMVGEIRDSETLDIAMKAALTGHLVLSTLHTNDAVSTVTRLVDMGCEPFLVASALELVSAQRLLRRLCPHCKEPAPDAVQEEVRQLVGEEPSEIRACRPGGCSRCHQGYRGRIAVTELLVMDDQWRRAVADGCDPSRLREIARASGMRTLRQVAARLVAQGVSSLEEVLRVAS